jgi:serine/threonine protein kinase
MRLRIPAALPGITSKVRIGPEGEGVSETQLTNLGGRYQILGQLGSGGMAKVMRARDLNLQREVAIKILHEDLIRDVAFQARFLQEARSAANLIHPNIVTVYDFGQDAERYFIVMEYVVGTDLKTLIRRRGRLQVDEAVELMIQMAAGVGYAHRAGLVHCDLKPHNILVAADGRVKITDFGISRALASINPSERSDVVWGSPQYFAPEQASGGAPSPATDVYALGVIFFEMLTGRLPFEATDAGALAELHLNAPPPQPRSLNPDIPAPLETIVLKVLSKEPAARYRTADQLGRVLMTYASQAGMAEVMPASMPAPEPVHDPEAMTAPMDVGADQVDWLAVLLGLLAFIAVGGLIPLWVWACLLYPTCPLSGF